MFRLAQILVHEHDRALVARPCRLEIDRGAVGGRPEIRRWSQFVPNSVLKARIRTIVGYTGATGPDWTRICPGTGFCEIDRAGGALHALSSYPGHEFPSAPSYEFWADPQDRHDGAEKT